MPEWRREISIAQLAEPSRAAIDRRAPLLLLEATSQGGRVSGWHIGARLHHRARSNGSPFRPVSNDSAAAADHPIMRIND